MPRQPYRPELTALEPRETPAAVGTLDPAFAGDGRVVLPIPGSFNAVAAGPNGTAVAVGTSAGDFLVARFLPDGRLDPSFSGDGLLTVDIAGGLDTATAVAVRPDGTILVGGTARVAGTDDFALVRISADGAAVETRTRDINDNKLNDQVRGLAINPTTGDIYLAGSSGPAQAAVARYDAALNLLADEAFSINGLPAQGTGVAIGGDGRVYVSAEAFGPGGTLAGLARLNADLLGLAANTYTISTAQAVAIDPASPPAIDRIYLAGFVGGDTAVLRIGPDLAERARTVADLGGSDGANAVALDARGRVVAAGSNDLGEVVVARFTPPELALDPSFGTGGKQAVDYGGSDSGFGVTTVTGGGVVVVGRSGANPAAARLVGTVGLPGPVLATGPRDGSGELFVLSADLSQYRTTGTAKALIPGLPAAVRAAVADVNGDGVDDHIAVAGPGAAPRVVVLDGKTGATLADFLAFEPSFTGGLFVAAADMDGDGKAEVVVTPDQTGGPVVALYAGSKLSAGLGGDAAQVVRFFGIDDVNFRGGARPALGDVNADGVADLVVAAGFGGGPRVAVFDGRSVLAAGPAPARLVPDFFAFEDTVRNGVFVAAGDIDGDGFADLAFGGGPDGAPRVRVASGRLLPVVPNLTSLDAASAFPGLQLANFFAGDPATRGGVPLTLRDIDGDNRADLVAASGEGLPARLLVYLGAGLGSAAPGPVQVLAPFGGATLPGGVFVG